jgi:hypothetical protein
MTEKITGRCLCGDIRYEYSGTPSKILHCHCESCRRHASSPITTFVCVAGENFRYTSGTPVAYVSSPGVTRTHCGRCGSPYHVHVAEQLPWFETADALPRYQRGKKDNAPLRHGPREI